MEQYDYLVYYESDDKTIDTNNINYIEIKNKFTAS